MKSILHDDRQAKIGDMQECMRIIWSEIKEQEIVALNNGLIVHTGLMIIEFCVTAGGTPFPGAQEAISALHRRGVFIHCIRGPRRMNAWQIIWVFHGTGYSGWQLLRSRRRLSVI